MYGLKSSATFANKPSEFQVERIDIWACLYKEFVEVLFMLFSLFNILYAVMVTVVSVFISFSVTLLHCLLP